MARLLRLGSRGEDVRYLQARLNFVATVPGRMTMFALLAEDGIFGQKTHRRVCEFQAAQRLKPDGIVGPKTEGKLSEIAGGNLVPKNVTGGVGPGAGKVPGSLGGGKVPGSLGGGKTWGGVGGTGGFGKMGGTYPGRPGKKPGKF